MLQISLETIETERTALESERKAQSKVDQELLALQGRVMGTEEANVRLREQVTQQEEGLSILENTRLGMYLFRLWLMSWFFPFPCL